MKLPYEITLTETKDGPLYTVKSTSETGLVGQGSTLQKAIDCLIKLETEWLNTAKSCNISVPREFVDKLTIAPSCATDYYYAMQDVVTSISAEYGYDDKQVQAYVQGYSDAQEATKGPLGKTGKWIHMGHSNDVNFYMCSNCGYVEHDNFTKHQKYCPHCGWCMEGTDD